MTLFLQAVLVGLTLGAIYGMIAIAIVLIYKATSVFNFAHGEFIVIGSYACWSILVSLELNMWLALLVAMILGAGLGLLVERVCFRPMIGQPVLSMIVVTLALAIFLRGAIILGWGGELRGYPALFSTQPLALYGLTIGHVHVWAGIASVAIIIGCLLFAKYTKAGLKMRASAEDEQVAQAMGVDVRMVFAMVWAMSGVLAVVGGFFLGNIAGVSLALGLYGLKALPVVLLGGLESIGGALIAGLIIGVLESLAGVYIDPLVGGGFAGTFPFIILIVVLLLRPSGLFGQAKVERV